MWGIALVVAAVMSGMGCAAQGQDMTSTYINCANLFYAKIDNRLKSDQASINSNFKMMNTKLNNGQRDARALKDKVLGLEDKVHGLDAKMTSALANISPEGGFPIDTSQLEASITAKLDALTQTLEGQVKAVVDGLLGKVGKVLQAVRTVKDDEATVNNQTQGTMEELKKCHHENAAEAVGELITKIDELKGVLEGLMQHHHSAPTTTTTTNTNTNI